MSMAAINDRAVMGGNLPPGPIDNGMDTATALSRWLAEHPLILTEDKARDAKILLDRARSSAGEIEDARKRETAPLNEQLTEINGRYKAMHNTDPKKPGILDRVTRELGRRMTEYIGRVEAQKLLEAEKKRKAAEEAERIAREAEAREKEAIENAKAGELGVDVTQVVVEADSRFKEFQKADRAAQLAERETNVRIAGGWMKSASLRTKETLVLVSYGKAICAIGPNEKIREAILSAARDYRKEKGQLPDGVSSEITREI